MAIKPDMKYTTIIMLLYLWLHTQNKPNIFDNFVFFCPTPPSPPPHSLLGDFTVSEGNGYPLVMNIIPSLLYTIPISQSTTCGNSNYQIHWFCSCKCWNNYVHKRFLTCLEFITLVQKLDLQRWLQHMSPSSITLSPYFNMAGFYQNIHHLLLHTSSSIVLIRKYATHMPRPQPLEP